MIHASFRPSRIALVGMIGVSVAIAISSFGVVRAQRFLPLGSVSYSCSTGRACITGKSTGGQPVGVLGVSLHNNGVQGESSGRGRAGVEGVSLASGAGGVGVYGESADISGKYAALIAQGDKAGTNLFYADNRVNKTSCLIDPDSNLTCTGTITAQPTTSNAGIIGQSSSNFGVYGTSSSNDGVRGVTNSGSASGVAGISTGSAYGVYGSSSGGTGVLGTSAAFGAYGVAGMSTGSNSIGVYAKGAFGLIDEGTADTALTAYADNSSSLALFAGGKGRNAGSCSINFQGDESCTGTIMGGQDIQTRHRTSTGRHVLTYAAQTTSATVEDFGTAQMVEGAARVRLDPTFASALDPGRPYYVFLTPLGDTRGLYVSDKSASGFEVRETGQGHSTLGFDYRIVAHPLDAKNDRLPPAPPVRSVVTPPGPPRVPVPPPGQ